MLYLFGCLVSSIAFGIGLVCKIVDMVHSTNTDKLKDYKLILSICVSGLAISWQLNQRLHPRLGNIVVALFYGFD